MSGGDLRVVLLISFTLFYFGVNAQRQADSFINGGCYLSTSTCHGWNKNIVLKFNDDSLEQIIEPYSIGLITAYSRAAFSDKRTGDLIFASNGWRLVNSRGDVLAHRLWREDIPWPGDSDDTTMVINTMGPLFLNDPGDSTKAYLLYGQYKTGNFGNEILKADVLFTYAQLDIPTQRLISKNNVILDEMSASGDMQACRHANGRDWWVIKPGTCEDEYFIGLLDPSGLTMQRITIPGLPHRGQFETLSFFSHDGKKFIHSTGTRHKYVHE